MAGYIQKIQLRVRELTRMKKHRIKLSIKNPKQLNELIACGKCDTKVKYRTMYFYIDANNIKITDNAKGICKECYLTQLHNHSNQ
jgi:hypothetical protein